MSTDQLWRSERLVYRSVEKEDEPFLYNLDLDSESFLNSAPFLPVPRSKKGAESFREFLADKCLLGALVCIPSEEDPEDVFRATPIGVVHLTGGNEPPFMHHRRSSIGVKIGRKYQSKGYGTEAIKWITQWGFRRCNLHRIGIGAFAWNTGALNLYERLGFRQEGRSRDYLWHDGKYHDVVEFAMLEDEWREKYGHHHQTVATTTD